MLPSQALPCCAIPWRGVAYTPPGTDPCAAGIGPAGNCIKCTAGVTTSSEGSPSASNCSGEFRGSVCGTILEQSRALRAVRCELRVSRGCRVVQVSQCHRLAGWLACSGSAALQQLCSRATLRSRATDPTGAAAQSPSPLLAARRCNPVSRQRMLPAGLVSSADV